MAARGKQVRRTMVLWPEEWAELERLAVEFDTCPPAGSTAGRPAWRSLLKELARGHLKLERISEVEVIGRVLESLNCPICGREVVFGGPGAQHLQAHVEKGEAVDLGEEFTDWTERYVAAE